MADSIPRTAATGGAILPELLAWSSSLHFDLRLVREDILGSLAHIRMLGKTKIVKQEFVERIASALGQIYDEHRRGTLQLNEIEEDVHMAVEKLLSDRLGEIAGHLHTARSRNDQIALDLRLHCREQGRTLGQAVINLAIAFVERGELERQVYLPSYTHRQRAQPVSAAMYFGAWSAALLRATKHLELAMEAANILPLGAGASSGTSLPIDRNFTKELLGFSDVTWNALDTVGDRDFAIDLVMTCSRVMNAISRFAQDMVDFSTSEFGFVKLDGAIAAGSSMMPQKKNPNVFELLRAKSAGGVARVVHMLTLTRALPTGYNRDVQEDRQPLFSALDETAHALAIGKAVLPHIAFDGERCLAALSPGFAQATDVAESLVRQGMPFRDAYRKTGALVADAIARDIDLTKQGDPALTPQSLDPKQAADSKQSAGGTGQQAIAEQYCRLRDEFARQQKRLEKIPTLDAIANQLIGDSG